MSVNEQDIERWEADQRCCDMADAILKLFAEKQFSVRKSLWTLEKAKKTIEWATQSASWGAPLTCGPAPNEASVFNHEAIKAEVARRKSQDGS